MLIAMLAIAAYLGINFSSHALKNNADLFYRQHNYRDIEITSTMLLTEEDMEALKNTEGVADIEGVYTAIGTLSYKDGNVSTNVVSLSERFNTTELKDGNMPQAADECVLEEDLMNTLSLSIGDTIKITDAKGDTLSYLNNKEYKITGSVIHPDHIALTTYVPGDRYVLVNKDAFDSETLEGCFTKAEIRVAGAEKYYLFGKEYNELIKTVKDRLDPLNDEMAQQREASVKNKMQSKIDEGQQKLDDGKKQLDDGKKKLEDSKKKLEDGEKKLADGKKQLDDGKKQLDDGRAELANAEAELASAKAQLDDGKVQLNAGEAELDQAYAKLQPVKAQLDDGKKQLDEGKAKLDSANAQLVDAYNQAEDYKTEVRNLLKAGIDAIVEEDSASQIHWSSPAKISDAGDPALAQSIGQFAIIDEYSFDLTVGIDERARSAVYTALDIIGEEEHYDEVIAKLESNNSFQNINSYYNSILEKLDQWTTGQAEYIDGLAQYNEKEKEYLDGLAQFNEGWAKYQDGLAQFNEKKALYDQGLAEYNNGLAQYQSGLATLEEKQAEYDKGVKEYEDGVKELENGKKELADGEKTLQEKTKEYEKGVTELEDAKKQLADLSSCYFVMLDNNGNGGFTHIKMSSDNLGKIGITFALLFILVGALVIYVTMGRIIGEQRTLVGAQKALGFFSKEVFGKYLAFGVSATLFGMLLGTVAGYIAIQGICVHAHMRFYVVEHMSYAFVPVPFVIVIVAGILLSAFAVWWACSNLLRQTARDLMQPELPKAKKNGEAKPASARSSLYSRLILRNMLMDWRRVLITIISVAGCCALLVIGFFFNFSINNSIRTQFDNIMGYDYSVRFNKETSEDAEDNIVAALAENGITGLSHHNAHYSFDTKTDMSLASLVCSDLNAVKEYFDLRPAKGTEKTWSEEGLLIPYKFSESYNISVGDTMTIYDTDMTPRKVPVSGIYNNYLGNFLFISEGTFNQAFGRQVQNNEIWLKSNKSKQELSDLLGDIKGFSTVISKNEDKQTYTSLASVLTAVTAVLIVAAGLLAFFVLLNLINMYLNKKKRELTVMRINGFSTKEVIRYVSMESVVTTVLGIILGFLFGSILGVIIISTLEQPSSYFIKSISLPALALGALLTIVFSIVINAIALRKVKNLKLTDI